MSKVFPTIIFLLLFCVVAVLATWHAIVYYWLSDDAFISFRYVANFVNGHGLVFNIGEYVEGYTNFLWVLELSVFLGLLGIPPEVGATVLSAAFTVATYALVIAMACSTPFRSKRWAIAWTTVFLLAINRTFAVWATGGLETRQFTFFLVFAVFLAATGKQSARRLTAASFMFALAALTRPEAMLFGGLAIVWYGATQFRARTLKFSHLLAISLPFTTIVIAHFLWRYSYYGEWLPNTYYAKHVRPWPRGGFHFYRSAILETGLYLMIPLALLGTLARFFQKDVRLHTLALIILGAHVASTFRFGGDCFEYRFLDFYWPFLTLMAVEGAVAIAFFLGRQNRAAIWSVFTICIITMTIYCNVLQFERMYYTRKSTTAGDSWAKSFHTFKHENIKAAAYLPLINTILPWLDSSYTYCVAHFIALPHQFLKLTWLELTDPCRPYADIDLKDYLPDGALTRLKALGKGYYYGSLPAIDMYGLADHTVARMPVTAPNEERVMGHDRKAPQSYLNDRGVNVYVGAPAASWDSALSTHDYAIRASDTLWIPVSLNPAVADETWLLNGRPDVEVWSEAGRLR